MKSQYGLLVLLGGIGCFAQLGPAGDSGGGAGSFNPSSCAQQFCTPKWENYSCSVDMWRGCACAESGVIEIFKSCVASSSCTDTGKNEVYQSLATLCASSGTTLTNPPETSFTRSLLRYSPTNSRGPNSTPWHDNHPSRYDNSPWSKGAFLKGGSPGYWTSGPWTSGSWTSWWNGKDCPDFSWPGWTSGIWSSDPQWTSWTACSAETTSTTAVTTTDTKGLLVTETSFGVKVAEKTVGINSASTTMIPNVSANIVQGNQGTQLDYGVMFWAFNVAILGGFLLH